MTVRLHHTVDDPNLRKMRVQIVDLDLVGKGKKKPTASFTIRGKSVEKAREEIIDLIQRTAALEPAKSSGTPRRAANGK